MRGEVKCNVDTSTTKIVLVLLCVLEMKEVNSFVLKRCGKKGQPIRQEAEALRLRQALSWLMN